MNVGPPGHCAYTRRHQMQRMTHGANGGPRSPAFDDGDSGLGFLLGVAAGRLIKDDDPAAFADWFATAAPALMPDLFDKGADPGRFARVLARSLYGLTPLPRHGYVPHRLPPPGRNEPCFCGSGRKYKHCCEPFESRMPFPNVNMLRYVLDTSPRDIYATLPKSRVRIDAVADTAGQWNDEGRARDVAALLEPWFAGEEPLPGRLDMLFDMLMDAYLTDRLAPGGAAPGRTPRPQPK